jgi:hypothetical protein
MKIEVLGTGCYNCIQLESLLADALSELGMRGTEVVRVSEEKAIRRRMPLEALPGLVINGVLVSTGKLPERETLRGWLTAAAQPAETP